MHRSATTLLVCTQITIWHLQQICSCYAAVALSLQAEVPGNICAFLCTRFHAHAFMHMLSCTCFHVMFSYMMQCVSSVSFPIQKRCVGLRVFKRGRVFNDLHRVTFRFAGASTPVKPSSACHPLLPMQRCCLQACCLGWAHPITSFSSQCCHIKVTELLHAISMTALCTSSVHYMCTACCDKPALPWYQMILAAPLNLHCKHAVKQSMPEVAVITACALHEPGSQFLQ